MHKERNVQVQHPFLQAENVDTDLEERKNRGKPWNTYHQLKGIPDVLVYPQ
jgi:hypothetical protein